MKFLKKYYKLIGTLITVVAFVFVIKKIVTMDVDWSMFASGKPLGIIAGCVLVQTAIIFFMSPRGCSLCESCPARKSP